MPIESGADCAHPTTFGPAEIALLNDCLGHLATAAPCRPRIDAVMEMVTKADGAPVFGHESIFPRAVSMAAVIWAIDSDRIGENQGPLAQSVMDTLWGLGPIRPELVAAQLRCLVGQGDSDIRCFWTCSALARENAGYATGAGPIRVSRTGLAGSMVLRDLAPILPGIEDWRRPGAHGGGHRHGEPVPCLACGRDGTILGVDPEDGWTVVDHHPRVVEREDGMWAVDQASLAGPRQCRYLENAGEIQAS
jgi:hypothetical protein